jgi:hypothetical protein
MATNASNSIEFIAHLPTKSKDDFRQIWHLESVQIAKSDDGFWLKGFSQEDLKSTVVRSMLKLKLFELRDNLLFEKENRVPERKMPSGLLWHPIQRALKIDLPSFNENFFEVNGKLNIEFKLSSEEQQVWASIVKFDDLHKYVDSIPNHYFNDVLWCKYGSDQVFLLGTKVLPIISKRYWKFQDLLIPVGYDLKYPFLKQIIIDFKNKSEKDEFWIFNSDEHYIAVPKDQLIPMSRSSVKFTIQEC